MSAKHSYRIFHNPRCSKSRKALAFLQDELKVPEKNLEVYEYLEGLNEKTLESLLEIGNFKIQDLIRLKEAKEEGLESTDLPEAKLIKFIAKNPRVLQRPVVVKDSKRAVIAREENWFQAL